MSMPFWEINKNIFSFKNLLTNCWKYAIIEVLGAQVRARPTKNYLQNEKSPCRNRSSFQIKSQEVSQDYFTS
jgi:hypothetical protein